MFPYCVAESYHHSINSAVLLLSYALTPSLNSSFTDITVTHSLLHRPSFAFLPSDITRTYFSFLQIYQSFDFFARRSPSFLSSASSQTSHRSIRQSQSVVTVRARGVVVETGGGARVSGRWPGTDLTGRYSQKGSEWRFRDCGAEG